MDTSGSITSRKTKRSRSTKGEPDDLGPPPSLAVLEEKRRVLEQRRAKMEQEKREFSSTKKKLADGHDKFLKQNEETRRTQVKTKALEDKKNKLAQIVPVNRGVDVKDQLEQLQQSPRQDKELEQLSISTFQQTQTYSYGGPKEVAVLLNLINEALDEDFDFVPFTLYGREASNFEELSYGKHVCRYINKMKPGTIKPSAIKGPTENWKLCLDFIKPETTVTIEPEDLVDGNPEALLTIIWEISRICLEYQIRSLESLDDLEIAVSSSDTIENILVAWVNLLIPVQGRPAARDICNDFKNSFFYLHLCQLILGQDPKKFNDLLERQKAEKVVEFLDQLKMGPLITADALLEGSFWANYICLSKLFLYSNADAESASEED